MLPLLPLLASTVASPTTCNESLGWACEASRLTGLSACGQCISRNDDKLKSAGCSTNYSNAFCQNLTCAPSLYGQCRYARDTSLPQCATCIGKNGHLLRDVCTDTEEKEFCPTGPFTNGTCIATLTGHSSYVVALAPVSPTVLASGSWDNTINLWDTQNHTCIATLTGHSSYVYALALVSPTVLASGHAGANNTIKLWRLK